MVDELENDALDSVDDNDAGNDESKVYEAGFHIVPNIPPESAKIEFESIKKMIADSGASMISEGEPVLRSLSYTLSKTVKAVKSSYDKAYFGWVKFETSPNEINKIKMALDENPSVIRHLIVVTVRENTLIGKTESEKSEESGLEENISKDLGKETSIEDLDKTIDELVVQ